MLSGQDWTLGALTGEFREISFSHISYNFFFFTFQCLRASDVCSCVNREKGFV